jgi:hypothetical protein
LGHFLLANIAEHSRGLKKIVLFDLFRLGYITHFMYNKDVQWAPLNGINGIMISMGGWNQIYPDLQVPNYYVIPYISLKLICLLVSFIQLQSNWISYGLAYSDPIKQRPLYLVFWQVLIKTKVWGLNLSRST